jgi:hypothetical protein
LAGDYCIATALDLIVNLEPTALDAFPKLKDFYGKLIASKAFDGLREMPMYLSRN